MGGKICRKMEFTPTSPLTQWRRAEYSRTKFFFHEPFVSEHGNIDSCCFNSVSVLFFVCLIAKYYIYCYLEEHFLLIQIAGYSTPIKVHCSHPTETIQLIAELNSLCTMWTCFWYRSSMGPRVFDAHLGTISDSFNSYFKGVFFLSKNYYFLFICCIYLFKFATRSISKICSKLTLYFAMS